MKKKYHYLQDAKIIISLDIKKFTQKKNKKKNKKNREKAASSVGRWY